MLFLVSNGNTAAADTFAATMASNPAAVLAPGTFGAVTVTSVAQGTQSITVDPSLLTAPTGGGDGPPVGKLVGGIVGGVCGAALLAALGVFAVKVRLLGGGAPLGPLTWMAVGSWGGRITAGIAHCMTPPPPHRGRCAAVPPRPPRPPPERRAGGWRGGAPGRHLCRRGRQQPPHRVCGAPSAQARVSETRA